MHSSLACRLSEGNDTADHLEAQGVNDLFDAYYKTKKDCPNFRWPTALGSAGELYLDELCGALIELKAQRDLHTDLQPSLCDRTGHMLYKPADPAVEGMQLCR